MPPWPLPTRLIGLSHASQLLSCWPVSGTSEATRTLCGLITRHRAQEVSLSPLCWDFPLRNIVGSQLGQKHSCVEVQEEEGGEEGGYEEEDVEEVEEGKEKGWERKWETGGGGVGEDALVKV